VPPRTIFAPYSQVPHCPTPSLSLILQFYDLLISCFLDALLNGRAIKLSTKTTDLMDV
jgi:hypothetical protein